MSVSVTIAGESIPMIADCAVEDGWQYTAPDGPYDNIRLCGAACDALTVEGQADLCQEAGIRDQFQADLLS